MLSASDRDPTAVASFGTRARIILLLGRDNENPLFLQLKQAQASVLEPFWAKANTPITASGLSRASG